MEKELSLNHFVEFYGKHNISPVSQDISDLNIHFKRRRNLYKTLGIPQMTFKNKSVLEVGPGSGYNTLYFFEQDIKHALLIEANNKGYNDCLSLFDHHYISRNRYSIENIRIEQINTTTKFDLIFAEGFIQAIENKQEVINLLKKISSNDGIIVLTCSDDIGFFFEDIRRILAFKLIKNEESFLNQVQILSEAFKSHLDSLSFASRSIEHWVTDQFLNPAVDIASFSFIDAIKLFGDSWDILGASPDLFNNMSWYKDITYDISTDYTIQYYKKCHTLLSQNMEMSLRCEQKNKILCNLIKEFKQVVNNYKVNKSQNSIKRASEVLNDIVMNVQDLDLSISSAIIEAKELIENEYVSIQDISNANYLKSSFGKGQQYISFEKNKENNDK